MYALIDCNSFFASVEKAFHPGLDGRPVCVLSSNDGNVVALTPEAKALGIRRGDPYFKVRPLLERNGGVAFSGNLMLYAAMSRRIVSIIRRSVPDVESYSIDECFADLRGFGRHCDIESEMHSLADRIRLWTDVPVSIGVAPTKTLAKIGSKFAKQYRGYRSVCIIDSEEKRRKALSLFDLSDVWGVGRSTLKKLLSIGVTDTLQFADMDLNRVRRELTVSGVRTWMELNGIPCVDTAEIVKRQSITTSRSFGVMVSSREQLRASVASFASSCANTLRGQGSAAGRVSVFVMSNRFREDLPQYSGMGTVDLPVPSADTIELVEAAMKVLDDIYRPGIMYKKSGVILSNIVSGPVQRLLFDTVRDRSGRLGLSKAMDAMNHKYGVKTVRLAVEGGDDELWRVKSEYRTPNYLTDINELLTVG